MDANGRLAVVVATRDRRDDAVCAARRAVSLPDRPRVVVVDDGSQDGTTQAVGRAVPGADVVRLDRSRGAAARTVGVRRAGTPYVAFCDDDSWWEPRSLDRAVSVMERCPRLGVVAARVLVKPGGRLDPTCAAMAADRLRYGNDLPGPAVVGFVACGAVVRSSAYLEAGGFPLAVGLGGEEAWLAAELIRRGWALSYMPDVVAHHEPQPSQDRAGRSRRCLRNDLWFDWAMRPPGVAIARSIRRLRPVRSEGMKLGAALDAVQGLPWALGRRRPFPGSFERLLQAVQ